MSHRSRVQVCVVAFVRPHESRMDFGYGTASRQGPAAVNQQLGSVPGPPVMYTNPVGSSTGGNSRPTSSSGFTMAPSHQAMQQRDLSTAAIPATSSQGTAVPVAKTTGTQKEKKSGTGANSSKPKEKKSRSRLACLACKSTKQKCDGPIRGESLVLVLLRSCYA